MNNERAYKLLEERFSGQVKTFNRHDVSAADADTHYWAVKDRLSLASLALDRAPAVTVTTLARSLGDVYRAIRTHLSADERKKWEALGDTIEKLSARYGV